MYYSLYSLSNQSLECQQYSQNKSALKVKPASAAFISVTKHSESHLGSKDLCTSVTTVVQSRLSFNRLTHPMRDMRVMFLINIQCKDTGSRVILNWRSAKLGGNCSHFKHSMYTESDL